MTAQPAAAASLPGWLSTLAAAVPLVTAEQLSRLLVPEDGTGRPSAVLVLFGDGDDGPDLLLIQRAADLRAHAGQPAFPGGAIDDGDAGPTDAALREAREETGLNPSGVEVFGELPELWLPYSGYRVTPVLGWWRAPSPVRAAEPAEVESVHRVPLAELVDPANRLRVRHPSGVLSPAFKVRGLTVWGFTAGLLDGILSLGGWAQPWDASRVEPLVER